MSDYQRRAQNQVWRKEFMTDIHISLPRGAKSIGSIKAHPAVSDLSQDIFQVELSGDVFVHVGWLPEYDLSGRYIVSAFHETLDEPLLPIGYATNEVELKKLVEDSVTSLNAIPPVVDCSSIWFLSGKLTRNKTSSASTNTRTTFTCPTPQMAG